MKKITVTIRDDMNQLHPISVESADCGYADTGNFVRIWGESRTILIPTSKVERIEVVE